MARAEDEAPPAGPSGSRAGVLQRLGALPGRIADAWTRPPAALAAASLSAEQLAERVVRSPRGNAYLALEPGLAAFEAEAGTLAWAARRRTAFAVGGVHGPDPSGALEAFREALRGAGYRRALLFPVDPAEREAVRRAGFEPLTVGAEPWLDPRSFGLSGNRMADLRQMVNRARKRYGLVAEEIPPAEAGATLGPLHARWLASRPSGWPMALVVGGPGFERPLGRRYVAARTREGEPVAAVTLTPGRCGAIQGVDVMMRAPEAPAGAMELVLVHTLELLAAEGVERLTLGPCPMAEHGGVGSRDRALLRAAFRTLYRTRLGNRLFPFRSLAAFKAKFRPAWRPVDIAAWPRMGVRALYAGCRMWGLFGPPALDAPPAEVPRLPPDSSERPGPSERSEAGGASQPVSAPVE